MLTGKFISIQRIAERVFNSGLNNDEIQFYDIVEWVGEAICLIGVPYAYDEKISDEIAIADYRGSLPTDVVKIHSVREYDDKYPMVKVDGSFPPVFESNSLPNE